MLTKSRLNRDPAVEMFIDDQRANRYLGGPCVARGICNLLRLLKDLMVKIKATIIAIALAMLPVSAWAVSQEQIERMKQAAPSEPFAEPQTERKMLIFSRCEGFAHSSIPYFEKAMEIVAQSTGAFSVDISTDMAVFEDGTLEQYDVLCFNNTTHLEPNEQQRQGILDFLADGKGVVGIHGATDNFYQWPEGAIIMGGWFDGHPWNASGTWSIKVTEPNHPLNARFSEPIFQLREEIYKLRWASLENLRILMELDLSDTATRQADEDVDRVPISWVRTYGPGRVFYSGLGHNHDIFWNEEILNHFLAGIQYAAGDLEVPDEPLEDELTTRQGD